MKPLELIAAAATDVGIYKKTIDFGSPLDVAGQTTLLVISNKEMEDIMKIFKSLDGFDLFTNGDI